LLTKGRVCGKVGFELRALGFGQALECCVAFTLRDAGPDDLETLWRIDQSCFSQGIAYSRQELRFFMRRRGAFTLVAVNEDGDAGDANDAAKIGGFIIAHGGATGHIITIDVVASARRGGLGSQLLLAAEDRLRSAGSRAVNLETAVDNRGALLFYKRHGYEVVEAIPGYYADGADAFLLRKALKGA
jgi:[ribosomal protein S18]-alanine N-acetyltransferase